MSLAITIYVCDIIRQEPWIMMDVFLVSHLWWEELVWSCNFMYAEKFMQFAEYKYLDYFMFCFN